MNKRSGIAALALVFGGSLVYVAGYIERDYTSAREAKEPAAHAAACLKLDDAWAAARGKQLTYPLDTDETRRKV